ncbi:MAG: hypothetical protein RL260_3463, partial [Pseudomonadota bacterium]
MLEFEMVHPDTIGTAEHKGFHPMKPSHPPTPPQPLTPARLRQARAQQHELIAHARPAMEFIHEQTRDTDSIVLLSDAQGMLLETLGDAAFANRAERVALRPGANWHEQWRGTNAIGTA